MAMTASSSADLGKEPTQHPAADGVQLKEALKSAIADTLPSLKDTAKEAVKLAAREQEAEKKAKDKKEKKETGIKPRDFILPAIVCVFMCIPVVGIFLPVYFTAGTAYEKGANQIDYACAITEVPGPIARAWNNFQKTDKSTKNATVFMNLLAARSQRPAAFPASPNPPPIQPGALATTAVSAYLGHQQCACNQIASLVFDDAGSWNCASGPEPGDAFSKQHNSTYPDLIATFLGELGDKNYPPPAPPSPPSPPHIPGWVDSPSPPPKTLANSDATVPDYAGDEYHWDEGVADDYYAYVEEYMTEAAGAPVTGRRLAQASPAPAAPAKPHRVAPTTVFNALTYNVTSPHGLHAVNNQRIVGYMGVRVAVTKVDPQVGTASLSLQAAPFSLYTYPFGFVDRKKISVNLPKNVATVTTVLSAVGAASVRQASGDHAKSVNCDVTLSVVRSLYFYPFDSYQATVEIQSMTSDFNETSTPQGPLRWRTALLVRQRNVAVGWDVTVQGIASPYDGAVSKVTPSDDGEGYVRYTVTLSRTQFVQFFAVITLIFMWILGTFAVMYAIDGLYLRPRTLAVSEATMFFTAVFAYGNMRNLMPDVPKTIGVGVDFFGYIWIILMLMGTSALVYCRVVGQVVSSQPTLWDRYFNREYFLAWTAEDKKKKEEAKKKEEEAKKKEAEEKKKKEEEEIMKAIKAAEAAGSEVGEGGVSVVVQQVVLESAEGGRYVLKAAQPPEADTRPNAGTDTKPSGAKV